MRAGTTYLSDAARALIDRMTDAERVAADEHVALAMAIRADELHEGRTAVHSAAGYLVMKPWDERHRLVIG
jgi:hypothetical protein